MILFILLIKCLHYGGLCRIYFLLNILGIPRIPSLKINGNFPQFSIIVTEPSIFLAIISKVPFFLDSLQYALKENYNGKNQNISGFLVFLSVNLHNGECFS